MSAHEETVVDHTTRQTHTARRTPLVDTDNGIVSRDLFISEELYRREQRAVFEHSWLFVAHTSQLRKAGDFVTSRMGEESVIVVRDKTDDIRVFLNSCRHRGMKVCRYDEGNTRAFLCPYHGWSYGMDGALKGVPHFDAYQGRLDKSQWGLVPARVEIHKGGIFATWDQEGPSLTEWLGDMRVFIDGALDGADGTPGASEALLGVQKWIVPCNWKLVSENFAGDMYHGNVTHTSVERVGIGPGGKKGETRHGKVPSYRDALTSFPELGHAWRGSPPSADVSTDVYPFPAFESPEVEEYFREKYRRRVAAGHWPPVSLFGGGGTVFPNMSFHVSFPRTILVAHPTGPTTTEMWRWYFVDADAPETVRAWLRDYYLRYSGPAGMTEQDDMENWNYATAASRGGVASRYPYNYQQGLENGKPADSLVGAYVTGDAMSERNALTFYGRWSQLIEGTDEGAAR